MKKKSDRKDTSRPPRSRNTTPSAGAPATSTPRETALLNARIKPLVGHNFEELTDGASPAIPDSKSLRDVAEQLRNLSEAVEANALELDSGMRKLAALRKEKARETEEEKLAEDKKLRDDAADKLKRGVKRKEMAGSKDRPLTHGAHGVAAQDGSTGKLTFISSFITTGLHVTWPRCLIDFECLAAWLGQVSHSHKVASCLFLI